MPAGRGDNKQQSMGCCWAPFLTKLSQKEPTTLKSQAGHVSKSQESDRSGLFVLLVLLVSSGLVVWVVLYGVRPIAPAAHGLPGAS